MKKTFLLLIFILSYTFGNTQISQNELLVYFDGEDGEELLAEINAQLAPEDQILLRWISPLTQTHLWYFQSLDIQFELDGANGAETYIITNIIDANNGAGQATKRYDPGGNGGADYVPLGSYEIEYSGEASGAQISCSEDYSLFIDNGDYPVRISIVDSGVNTDVVGTNLYPFNPVITSGKSYYGINQTAIPDDLSGHGTHITSIVNRVSRFNNPLAETSIEFDIRRILDEHNSGKLSDLILAIEEAIVSRSQIINLSLGYYGNGPDIKFMERIKSTVEAKNVLLVVAAGNASSAITPSSIGNNDDFIRYLPAGMQSPNIITVGSLNCLSEYSRFSNFSNLNVDIAAPGEVVSGYNNNGEFVSMSGTSQATAIVTGIAASLATHMPIFHAPSIKCAIVSSAQPLEGFDDVVASGGVVDAENALNYLNRFCSRGDTRAERQTNGELNVFPNPFTYSFTVELDKGQNKIQVVNILGQVVYQSTVIAIENNQEHMIDTNLNGDFFSVSVVNDSGQIKSKKVIKF